MASSIEDVISFGSISELKNSSFCCISEGSSSASVASMGDLKAEVPLSTNSDFSGVFRSMGGGGVGGQN